MASFLSYYTEKPMAGKRLGYPPKNSPRSLISEFNLTGVKQVVDAGG
jgi:hypothetical protein